MSVANQHELILSKSADRINAIREEMRAVSMRLILEMAAELAKVHSLLCTPNGVGSTFGKWCREQCSLRKRSVHELLKIHKFATSGSDEKTLTLNCSREALSLLLRKHNQKPLKRAMAMANAGHRVTKRMAQKLVFSSNGPLEVCLRRIQIALSRVKPNRGEAVSAIDAFFEEIQDAA